MQIDMHYYATYAMAVAAGMRPEKAETVAVAAQFVDDNAHKQSVELRDGARVDSQATAHHAADLSNIDREDQRRVWIPFHFLPGSQGDAYTEKLVCRMDSAIAREMVQHNISLASKTTFGLELLGITAHVYEDTFSHYGFSGISSRRNRVVNDSFQFYELDADVKNYIEHKAKVFFKRQGPQGGLFENAKRWVISTAGETLSGALGHGAVATFPDRPYLIWSFETEHPEIKRVPHRNNPATFLLACERLHQVFKDYLALCPDHGSGKCVDFSTVSPVVKKIIATQADKQSRIRAWQQAAEAGDLLAGEGYRIPDYQPWHVQWEQLAWIEDSAEVLRLSLYRFFQAASVHRNYVLRQLLPSHGLVVK